MRTSQQGPPTVLSGQSAIGRSQVLLKLRWDVLQNIIFTSADRPERANSSMVLVNNKRLLHKPPSDAERCADRRPGTFAGVQGRLRDRRAGRASTR